jgi:hypothetical protein
LWVALRDERPWSGTAPPAVIYRYSPDRRGEHAEALLGGCRGFLHADAYAGFRSLYTAGQGTEGPRLVEVGCWAHARRKIFDVHEATGSPLAKEALEQIAELFAIEAAITGRPPHERLAVRQTEAVPKLAALESYLAKTLTQISGKSTLARAIRYATSRWPALARYTTDGRLEMSNNAAERAIRPLTLGRNYAHILTMRRSRGGSGSVNRIRPDQLNIITAPGGSSSVRPSRESASVWRRRVAAPSVLALSL